MLLLILRNLDLCCSRCFWCLLYGHWKCNRFLSVIWLVTVEYDYHGVCIVIVDRENRYMQGIMHLPRGTTFFFYYHFSLIVKARMVVHVMVTGNVE